MSSKLTYALFNNELTFISDPKVKNGYESGCICPECKKPLNARNNEANKIEKHFAHRPGEEDCPYAVESALHILAKNILAKNKKIYIPDFHFDYNNENSKSKFKDGLLINLETVILEKTIIENDIEIKPDAIGFIKGKEVFIEFAKTHFVDEEKLEKIKLLNKTCIEVKISHLELNEELLSDFLVKPSQYIYYKNNPKLNEEYKIHKEEQRKIAQKIESERRKKLVEQEQLMLEEQRRLELKNIENIKKYKYDINYKKFKVNEYGYSKNCPLKKVELLKKLEQRHKDNIVIKRILDGAFWNKEIYGYIPNGKYIFIGKEKTIIFPPDNERDKSNQQQERESKILYGGLQTIKSFDPFSKIGYCKNCEFNIAVYDDEEKYSVCNYKSVK